MKWIRAEIPNLAALVLLLLCLGALLSGYGRITRVDSQPIYRGEPVTVHCQVSPDTWKRYITYQGNTVDALVRKGVFSFKSERNGHVIIANCAIEGL